MAESGSNTSFRERLHQVIFEAETPFGKLFDVGLLAAIGLSVVVVVLESVPSIRIRHGSVLRLAEWVFTGLFTVEYLLRPENKDELVAVLTYHVLPGKVMSGDIAGKQLEAKTVQGAPVAIDATSGVVVGGANVVAADVEASNGVIHVIDKVILPPS